MPLASGTRVGLYEIVALLGQGGMGEVYRARDGKLRRDVALKILPEAFTRDPERLARFTREAQLLASLSHPNIATIFGVEDSGTTHALVLELIEGPTLADRLTSGSIPVPEALRIATQIAEALEAAHEKGIVHRDLKPANVKITPEDRVKVLDFGLGKIVEAGGADGENLANSPTLTAMASRLGVIVGTAAYMSPEQAKGKPVDRRTDIWAFGCVLYEMMTGKRAFQGDDVTDMIVSVMTTEPDWAALPRSTPSRIIDLLHRCFKKDPRERLRDIGDARLDIDAAAASPPAADLRSPAPGRHHGLVTSLTAAVIVLSIGLAWLWRSPRATPTGTGAVIRFSITPEVSPWSIWLGPPAVLSPDGQWLIYGGRTGSSTQLHLRSLDAFDGRGLPGTEGALGATFARDSRWILFSAGGKLKKVALAGGSVQVIADMRQFFGVDTTLDGRLIYTPDYNKGLARVAGDGGDPEVLTTPDQARHELGHWWPQVLPDGESVLFTGYTTPLDRARIGAYSFQTRKEITVLEGATNGHYLSSGYLAYFRKGALQVAPFDMKRLTITGSPVVLQDEVGFDGSSSTLRASFSDSGILAYQSARDTRVPRQLIAVDTSNRATALTSLARPYGQPRVAADGRRVAVAINEDNRDIWVLDVDRDTPRRITFGMAVKTSPLWTADSRRVIYSVERPAFDLFWTPVDGATAEELLLSSPDDKYATSVTPDGRTLAFTTTTLTTGEDIWLLPLDGERKPRAFRATPFNESQAAFSPDGRWIAYQSDESTRSEVYVEPFPGPGERVAVSAEGGRDPVWARNTKTLFYWNGDRLMAAPMRPGAGATVGRSTEVFRRSREGRLNPQSPEYDVLPDGRFLLVERDASTPPPEFKIVVNWYEELRRRTKPNQ